MIIKKIISYTKKYPIQKMRNTYKVLWDTGNVQENVSHRCLLSDAKELLKEFTSNNSK